ncbi:hypothetical protein [Nocardia vermiculata]|uniref:Uncharacterized protein n=1 Tax=Nocardia vermiculata TaxID=257274 RepID=A0A846XVX7_9NOCA|nr:hypothetical protein [Nocardia vermiculata]NKY49238.1 hypothetical protein [Nocardia vermiculata]
MTIETSQVDIARFLQAARGGAVTFDPDAARRCAQIYQEQADRLHELQQRLDTVAQLNGFGGFFSAEQLQAGFGRKARDAAELLDQYIAAAYRMKEAFLISAGLYEEADSAAAAALRAVPPGVPR